MKIISCALSPNTQADDAGLALSVLFRPHLWQKGEATGELSRWFTNYFGVDYVYLYDSGRSALFEMLRAFGIRTEDEVIVQAFTCVAVPNSVLWTGAKAVYADIDQTYNIDPSDIEKKITKKTKAIIVQHTFGIPAQIEKIVILAKKYNLYLFEDCAHALGVVYKGKKLGTFGDGAIFSFGRDKVLSSVWGGAAIIHTNIQAKKVMKHNYQMIPPPSLLWIAQQLFHPVAFFGILPLYMSGFGKMILVFLQKMHLLSMPIQTMEYTGGKPDIHPRLYPNALAILLLHQVNKLEKYEQQRKMAVQIYNRALKKNIPEIGLLRYPYETQNPGDTIIKARQKGVFLGNWYHHTIDPQNVLFSAVYYQKGSCPHAQQVASAILNLPTRVSPDEAKKVLAAIV